MSKKLCKGIKKDGSPCHGQGLDQFDGYCIAHAPADLTREWRSRGGKNSATAARLDKRIPERLKQAIDLVHDSMNRVAEGKISPAVCNAICRSAKTLIDLHRRADEEMDLIRTEETRVAAEEFVGVLNNLDILDAAGEIVDQQDQHRLESLVEQGYASYEEPSDPDEPLLAVLNNKGRRRFGYLRADNIQFFLDELKVEANLFDCRESDVDDLPQILDILKDMDRDAEEELSELARNDLAPLDPLTGQSITNIPTGVIVDTVRHKYRRSDERPQEVLQAQRRDIQKLNQTIEDLREDEDYKRRWEESEKHKKNLEELGDFLKAQKQLGEPKPLISSPKLN